MRANRLQLNAAKTEIIWCSSSRRQHQIPDAPVSVGTAMITPVHSVRDLGIYVDSDVTMRSHVAKTVSSCFAILRRIRSIRRSFIRPVLQTLVVLLVLTRLDYGSATLAGLPRQLLDILQSVMKAVARLIFSVRKYDHVTPLLRDLHWLRALQRIEYRLAVLAFRCQQGTAPLYLSSELQRVSDAVSGRRLWSAVNDGTGCAQDESVNNRRPCVSSCGRTRVEQSATGRYSVIFAVDFEKETENGTVFALLSRHLIFLLLRRRSCRVLFFCIVTLKFFGTICLVNAIRLYIHTYILPLPCLTSQVSFPVLAVL